MPERKIVIEELGVNYEGIMNIMDVYKLIDDWLQGNNYDKLELFTTEYVKPEGKYIELVLEPDKKVSDYVKNIIKVRLVAKNVKDVDVEEEGKKRKMQEGTLSIVFTGLLETDYEGRWEQKATIFFLRVLVDKYIYKFYTDRFENALAKDVKDLANQVKSFLNLYRY